MTRVSTFGHNQAMINSLLNNQQKLAQTQQQITTGKKAATYAGLARQVSPLVGAKSVQARTDQYQSAITEVLARLNFNDLHLSAMHDQVSALRQSMLDGLATDEFAAFDETLEQTFGTVVNALNAQVGGVYIFGGTRTDAPPVTIDSIDDLVALADVADAFQNSQIKPSAKVDDGVTVEYGMLAEDIGTSALASLKRIAEFHQGPDGPLDGKLTAAQRGFLETELANVRAAMDGLTAASVENGIRTNQVEGIRARHEEASIFLETFISEIEDVDMAEAITRLQQGQVAVEASLNVLSQLSRLSLLDFI